MMKYTTISLVVAKASLLTILLALCMMVSAQGIYVHNGAAFNASAGALVGFHGDITNDGSLTVKGGCAFLCSEIETAIEGDNAIEIDTLVLRMGAVATVSNEILVTKHLSFNNGIIKTDINDATDFVHFADGANYSGASAGSYVQGRVRKTGNEAFTFPVGDSLDIQAVSITAPANATDAFTAYYTRGNATDAGYTTSSINSTCGTDVVLRDVSEKEYWGLFRDAGTSDVEVTFDFDVNSEIVNLAELLVVNWDGTEWMSLGNAGVIGTALQGSITAGTACEYRTGGVYGVFSFGGGDLNTLPIELISFTGAAEDCVVDLNWTIEADGDLSHFEIQRSNNGSDFETIETIYDNTTTVKTYSYTDANPVSDSYYRLVSVDIYGEASSSELIYIQQACEDIYPMNVFPSLTTANGTINVSFYGTGEAATFDIFDLTGKKIKRHRAKSAQGNNNISIQLEDMTAGHYILSMVETGETQRIVIQ